MVFLHIELQVYAKEETSLQRHALVSLIALDC